MYWIITYPRQSIAQNTKQPTTIPNFLGQAGSVVLTGQPSLHVRAEENPLGHDLAGDGGGLGRHAGHPGGGGGPDGQDGSRAAGPHRSLGGGVHEWARRWGRGCHWTHNCEREKHVCRYGKENNWKTMRKATWMGDGWNPSISHPCRWCAPPPFFNLFFFISHEKRCMSQLRVSYID